MKQMTFDEWIAARHPRRLKIVRNYRDFEDKPVIGIFMKDLQLSHQKVALLDPVIAKHPAWRMLVLQSVMQLRLALKG